MSRKFNPQMNLFSPIARSSIVKELEQIFTVLDATPTIMDLVFQDIIKTHRPDTGQGRTDRRAGAAMRYSEAVPRAHVLGTGLSPGGLVCLPELLPA